MAASSVVAAFLAKGTRAGLSKRKEVTDMSDDANLLLVWLIIQAVRR